MYHKSLCLNYWYEKKLFNVKYKYKVAKNNKTEFVYWLYISFIMTRLFDAFECKSFNCIQVYLYSTITLKQSPRGALYCMVKILP